ncbi:hypothetical protein GCM10017691_23860 [Pseudonocardia petroleophila]|uniref:Uncharacterized protein n=1 Tax=Pseudonocardia petroleophila TaxID=37331 RepID=A0A7G7MFV7_9PSEU|nr:hypothetical protein [Pseudonocardia petroleophila]QNG51668.1 hypothetical protein H6H00_26770 [Pseudonocardia petroleophila]
MSTHKIRTTMQPANEITVSDAELLDLERQGLVLKSQATTVEGVQRAALKQVEAAQVAKNS